MPPIIIDLKNTDDPNDAVHLAVEFLAAGKLVALPTETVYGIATSALNADAADRLNSLELSFFGPPFSLAVKSGDDALDFVPDLPPTGKRLARRCWPGPLTIITDGTHPDSLLTQIPASIRSLIFKEDQVGLRVPHHRFFHDVSRLTIGPLILTGIRGPSGDYCTDGRTVVDLLGDQVDLILDDGSTKYAQPSTVAKIDAAGYQILREGVLGETALKRMSSFLALMVCTGNTCRSPMAEVLFKKHLAEKMGCGVDELEDKGVIVASAGVAAMPGAKASMESVEVVEKMGLDLSNHESQPVSDQLLESADLILTMTNGHRQALVAHWPEVAERTHVISTDGADVSDPIGGPLELYEGCARQIDAYLKEWANKVELGLSE